MIGRIVRSADFERVLRKPPRFRSPHFAVHHLPGAPGLIEKQSAGGKLLTGLCVSDGQAVDDLPEGASKPNIGVWFGVVVPKRHARRSVTRSLLKRQFRAAFERRPSIEPGLWIVRLRAPFSRDEYPSAASGALARAARTELDAMLSVSAPGTVKR